MKNHLLHHLWVRFRRVHPYYFLIIFILISIIAVFSLRQNNQNMVKLRSEVYTADKDNGNVEVALQNLRTYVYAHMNTDLASGPNAVYPPIQLSYTYNRLQQAEQQQVDATNATVYTDAQNYCQAQNSVSFSGRTRVPCIEAYVQQHGAKVVPIQPALYEFDFVSPTWSPDLAGFSLVLSFLVLILFVISLGSRRLSGIKAKH
jgi:preprotein translocase subunit SecF